jgi:plastocyanin
MHVLLASMVMLLGVSACSSSNTSAAKTKSSAPSASNTNAVTIKNYAFVPKSITVKVGTTVTWTNKDGFAHAIEDSATGQSGASNIDPNASYSHTYTKVGVYPYVCAIHATMHGTVTVTAS